MGCFIYPLSCGVPPPSRGFLFSPKFAANSAVNFRPGTKKAVALMCNRLVFSVDPEGHDPTTFGL